MSSPRNPQFRHGHARENRHDKVYWVWLQMRKRCHDPKQNSYPLYGGRGITVCQRWDESFSNFIADMGPRPSDSHSIERRNNDGPYSPENCYWATPIEQAANKRGVAVITFDGVSRTARQWELHFGWSHGLILYRLKHGWTIQNALSVRPGKGT